MYNTNSILLNYQFIKSKKQYCQRYKNNKIIPIPPEQKSLPPQKYRHN